MTAPLAAILANPFNGKLLLPRPIAEQIESLEARITLIKLNLPYADHGAYGQDQLKISRLTAELEGLDRKQEREQARVEAADLRKQAAANSSKGGLI